jgi:hypothetical protein
MLANSKSLPPPLVTELLRVEGKKQPWGIDPQCSHRDQCRSGCSTTTFATTNLLLRLWCASRVCHVPRRQGVEHISCKLAGQRRNGTQYLRHQSFATLRTSLPTRFTSLSNFFHFIFILFSHFILLCSTCVMFFRECLPSTPPDEVPPPPFSNDYLF